MSSGSRRNGLLPVWRYVSDALCSTCCAPRRSGFGEAYSKGLIEIHGDFLAFINEITAAITRKRQDEYLAPKMRSMLSAIRANTLDPVATQRAPSLRPRQRFLPAVARRAHGLHLRLLRRSDTATLAEAQVAKLDHVCRKLKLRPGQKVIEAGCGWGALALHMAEHYGVNVRRLQQLHASRSRSQGSRRAAHGTRGSRDDFVWTTIAIFTSAAMRSCRSACWSMSVWPTSPHWGQS